MEVPVDRPEKARNKDMRWDIKIRDWAKTYLADCLYMAKADSCKHKSQSGNGFHLYSLPLLVVLYEIQEIYKCVFKIPISKRIRGIDDIICFSPVFVYLEVSVISTNIYHVSISVSHQSCTYHLVCSTYYS